MPFWNAAYRGESVDWDRFLSSYRATTDWPACDFYGSLAQRYPDAKVILTTRDPESWYESVSTTIYPASRQPRPDRSSTWTEMVKACIWAGTFGGRFENRDDALDVYRSHVDRVRSSIAEDRLLVYEVREGWEPLCEFLGVPVPSERFPHENERQAFLTHLRQNRVRV